jgi:hypothetical protein
MNTATSMRTRHISKRVFADATEAQWIAEVAYAYFHMTRPPLEALVQLGHKRRVRRKSNPST